MARWATPKLPSVAVRIPEVIEVRRMQAVATDSFQGTFPKGDPTAMVISIEPTHRAHPGRITSTFDAVVQVHMGGEVVGTYPLVISSGYPVHQVLGSTERLIVQGHDTVTSVKAKLSNGRTALTLTVEVEYTLVIAKERTIRLLVVDQ